VSPVTSAGRAITIVYALIGIPLCLVVLASVGKLLTRAIKFVWMFVRRFYYTGSCRRVRRMIPVGRLKMTLLQRLGYNIRKRAMPLRRAVRRRKTDHSTDAAVEETCVPYEVDDEFNLPPPVAIIIGIAYTVLGALLYMSWEQWSYFEAFYFTCISLSTIGFGDVVPDHPKYFMASSVYMVVGLSLLAMIINVQMTAMHVTITKVIEAGQRLADSDGSEVAGVAEPAAETQPQRQSATQLTVHRHSPPMHRRRSV